MKYNLLFHKRTADDAAGIAQTGRVWIMIFSQEKRQNRVVRRRAYCHDRS